MSVCRRFVSLLVGMLMVVCAATVLAQSDTSMLSVVVTDPTGAAVPGATVTVRHHDTDLQRDAVTDQAGRATFALLPPGSYDTTATLDGFKQFRDPAVKLQVAQTATLDVVLQVGEVRESVEVRSAVRLLNLTSAAHGTVIGEDKV